MRRLISVFAIIALLGLAENVLYLTPNEPGPSFRPAKNGSAGREAPFPNGAPD
jgi:hypothetical protein